MEQPFISIIVPIYNAGKTLHKCIDCILAQTYINFELLLIDDDSSDNSRQICNEYAAMDIRIKVFHKKNGGACSARNVGLDKAKGDWITFCDADDWVYPIWLENYVNNLSADCDLVAQGFETNMDIKDNPLFHGMRKFGFNFTGDIVEGLHVMYKNPARPYLWCKLFKKSIIDQAAIRFDERLNFAEDDEFVMRYLTHCHRMNSVDSVGYYYYVPDYKSKYQHRKNQFYLHLSIYKSAYKIGGVSEFTDSYLYLLSCFLLYSFKIKSEDRKELLHVYRKEIGKDIFRTHMFAPTKWAIYLDRTGLLSSLVLNLHVKLKPLEELKEAAVW